MTNPMTPSMTGPQIVKQVAKYQAMLEKDAPNFSSEAVQSVLGSSEFAKAQHELFRTWVEARSTIITRTASVDRTRTPRAAMEATGRTPYLDEAVLAGMPLGTGDTVTMSFYRFGRYIECDQLDAELAKIGLEHVVDPIGQAAINEADQEFADKYPNCSQWGKFCYAIFVRWYGEREVLVDQDGRDWDGYWWRPVRSM